MRRIGVNLLWLVPGVVGGSEEHTTRLLRALAQRLADHDDLEVVLFVNRLFGSAHPDLVEKFQTVVAPLHGSNKLLRVLAESTWLPWASARHRIGLMHHAGGTIPAVRTCPAIVSIHDLQPLAFPENFSRVKRTYLATAIPRSARRARRVLVLTEWVRADVMRRTGVPEDRVVVVSPGTTPPERSLSDVSKLLERHDVIGRPFFLYPAITYPHKNHRVLVDALVELLETHPDAVLVLTGGAGPSEKDVLALIDQLGIRENVRKPGRISADDLEALYGEAAALAFPSLYEGFGIPVLEAMSRGCPVLAAHTTALPEVVGDAGVLIDPDSPDLWAEAMRRVLDDGDWRHDLVGAGLKRSGEYTWSRSAATLENLYREDFS